MRVLMVSPHFPPDSTGGAHRVRLLAPRLREHGWEPTVLTVDPQDYEGPLDPALADSVPSDVRVVRARAWPARVTRCAGVGDLGLRAFEGLWREASKLLAHERFDVVFVTIYPAYTAVLGPLLKRRFGVPFVLDYQDPWVGEWGRTVGGGRDGRADLRSRVSRFVASWLEPIALRSADGVTGVSRATFEPALRRNRGAHPRAIEALPIGWDGRDFERLRPSPPRAASTALRLACIGTLPPTMFDSVAAFFEALNRVRRAGGPAVRAEFIGTSSQRSSDITPRVLDMARRHEVVDLVSESPARLDYFDALQAFRDAGALLLLGTREAHYTPSRVYAALNSARPIVAVYHQDSPIAGFVRRFGGPPSIRLITYSDAHPVQERVEAIARELAGLIAQPIYDAGAVNRAVLSEASAATLAGRLAEVFRRVSSVEVAAV